VPRLEGGRSHHRLESNSCAALHARTLVRHNYTPPRVGLWRERRCYADEKSRSPQRTRALAKASLDELNLKITRQQLHNVLQGRSAVTPGMALRFEKAFGGSADMSLAISSRDRSWESLCRALRMPDLSAFVQLWPKSSLHRIGARRRKAACGNYRSPRISPRLLTGSIRGCCSSSSLDWRLFSSWIEGVRLRLQPQPRPNKIFTSRCASWRLPRLPSGPKIRLGSVAQGARIFVGCFAPRTRLQSRGVPCRKNSLPILAGIVVTYQVYSGATPLNRQMWTTQLFFRPRHPGRRITGPETQDFPDGAKPAVRRVPVARFPDSIRG